jgi:mono/diheme cytochrome c family protein
MPRCGRRLGILLIAVGLTACEKKPPPGVTDPGHLTYLGFGKKEVNCSRCHGPEGQGSWQGPDLRDVFTRNDSSKIVQTIKDGKGDEDDMPAFGDKLSDQEIEKLMQFLKSLGDIQSL